jgi:hypothetical protein
MDTGDSNCNSFLRWGLGWEIIFYLQPTTTSHIVGVRGTPRPENATLNVKTKILYGILFIKIKFTTYSTIAALPGALLPGANVRK